MPLVFVSPTSPLNFVQGLVNFGKGSLEVLATPIGVKHLMDEISDTHTPPMGFLLGEQVVFLL
jgi:hypothetical protein